MKHLLVVTDGVPQHVTPFSTADLNWAVGQAVQEGRVAGVNIAALIIGNQISDQDAEKMFGVMRWKRVQDTQEDLFYEMTDLVHTAFSNYLRR